jgi:membrane protein involved in colicin uptake
MPQYEYQSPYNDPGYNVSSMPYQPYQTPKPTEFPSAAKISPRAKAGLGLGAAAVATLGMFTWSQYETGQANAHVRAEQVAVDAAKVQLAQEQQAAAQAKAAAQETPAQKARRLAVEACINKAGSNFGGVADCGSIFPATGSPALANASSTSSTSSGSAGSNVGMIVLGSIGVVLAAGKAKKYLTAHSR